MKKMINLVVVVVCMMSLVGCATSASKEAKIVVDMAGNEVEIPNDIERVACIYPSTTDMMVTLGLEEYIAGTYRTTLDNPWTEKLVPESVDWISYDYDTSVETILEQDIDLVFIPDAETAETYTQSGICAVVIRQYTQDDAFDTEYYECARILGEIFGVEEEAEAWTIEVQDTIEEIQTTIEANDEVEAQTVYYVNGEKAKGLWYSDGGNSTIQTTLEILGQQLATEVYLVETVHGASTEEMISLNPDVIIIGGIYQQELLEELYNDPIWNELPCVIEGQVYTIPVGFIGIENLSAETPIMLKYLANMFYPDLFDYDIEQELMDCMEQYFNYSLSEEEAANMLEGISYDGKSLLE